jgi:hypothetical protein
VLTLAQKREVIRRLDAGEKPGALALAFSVSRQQISDVKRSRGRLARTVDTIEEDFVCQKRKSLKTAKNDRLDQALYTWFVQERALGTPVSGRMIQAKALQYNQSMGTENTAENFKASDGWLQKFKMRHGIRQLSIQGESMSADHSAIPSFLLELQKLVTENDLVLDQIYNADETGLFWKLLPNKTLTPAFEKTASGQKKFKDRITVLTCVNACGTHKLKLLLIGKSVHPRCFKHINLSALPLIYCSQKAWMTSAQFEEWFHQHFVPSVKQHLTDKKLPHKALLLVDNCTAHPHGLVSREGTIKCHFLPPNVTSLIQPLDQGFLEGVKKRYRKYMMLQLLQEQDIHREKGSVLPLHMLLKAITLKDTVYMVERAWRETTEETIKIFRKALHLQESNPEDEDDETTSEMMSNPDPAVEDFIRLFRQLNIQTVDADDVQEWLDSDKEIEAVHRYTDEEIVENVCAEVAYEEDKQANASDSEDEEDSDIVEKRIPSNSEAIDLFDSCLLWLEHQPDTDFVQLLQVRRMRDRAIERLRTSKKQMSVLDFFSRYR